MAAKAKAQATKMQKMNAAVEVDLAETHDELTDELASFGRAKTAKLNYLGEQFRSRKALRNGVNLTIPQNSPFRSQSKPYPLRLKPHEDPSKKNTATDRIAYLIRLLRVMITEDQNRTLDPAQAFQDKKLMRQLPVVSLVYINPVSVRLKTEQENRLEQLAAPEDNPWLAQLHKEYVGKILYDNGYFRVFDVLYVPNKGSKTRYPCWEATTETGFFEDGQFIVDERHRTPSADGKTILLKSSMVGFALAEYSNGDDVDPVRLTFADECHSRFLQRQARIASASVTANARPIRRKKARLDAASHSSASRRSCRTRNDGTDTSPNPLLIHQWVLLTLTSPLTLTLRLNPYTPCYPHPAQFSVHFFNHSPFLLLIVSPSLF
jgi:hypothetical protein